MLAKGVKDEAQIGKTYKKQWQLIRFGILPCLEMPFHPSKTQQIPICSNQTATP